MTSGNTRPSHDGSGFSRILSSKFWIYGKGSLKRREERTKDRMSLTCSEKLKADYDGEKRRGHGRVLHRPSAPTTTRWRPALVRPRRLGERVRLFGKSRGRGQRLRHLDVPVYAVDEVQAEAHEVAVGVTAQALLAPAV